MSKARAENPLTPTIPPRTARHMVAPETDQTPLSPAALFEWWRGALARALNAVGNAAKSLSAAALPALHDVATATRSIAVGAKLPQSRAIRVVSPFLVLCGASLSIGLSIGTPWLGREVLAFITVAIWAIVRLAVMNLVAGAPRGETESALRTAWSLGLLPFVIGLTPDLRLLALVVSAALTYRALRCSGFVQRAALRMVAWAWGIQLVAGLLSILARNGLVLFTALRS